MPGAVKDTLLLHAVNVSAFVIPGMFLMKTGIVVQVSSCF